MDNDSLTYYGGQVKALGDGKIGGYVALFTTENDPDLSGDFFTKATEFYLESGDQRPIIYDHGLDKTLKRRQLGRAKTEIRDAGVWMEGQLNLRDDYEQKVYKMAEMGKLGWSTGSASHLVQRTPKGKSFHLDSWPIVEASLTPMPVEPRTSAMPLKSMIEAHVDIDELMKSLPEEEELQADVILAGLPAINRFCKAVAPNSQASGAERSKAGADAAKEFTFVGQVIGEAFFSDTSRCVRRSEHRFLKSGREIDSATLDQVEQHIEAVDKVITALTSVKTSLSGIQQVAQVSQLARQAMNEKARLEMWNFCQITGTLPEDLEQ